MRVPDDVTLLWSDDNWGNLRRLPTPEERKRPGGAGIYYHFDYVGGPRSYKWLNTYSITKVWEQMNLALEYGADRIWVVNVGDLKPMEFPIEFFLSMAHSPKQWGKDNLDDYTRMWAAREFGEEHAAEIATAIEDYTRYNGRRKPEQLEPTTFSLTNYGEADRVDREWRDLSERVDRLATELPEQERASFFELVQYPVDACATVAEMYIAAGRNALDARLGAAKANFDATETRALFARDAALSAAYNHTLLNGRWDHMMDQTHIGYTFWNEPPLNAMPAVTEVQPASGPTMGVAVEGSPFATSRDLGFLALPAFDVFNRQTQFIDAFNRGTAPFEFSASADRPWIKLSETHGSVIKEERLLVSIDWAGVSEGTNDGTITLAQKNGTAFHIRVRAVNPAAPAIDSLQGFIESNHYVSVEAEHFTGQASAGEVHWDKIPGFGETLSGMIVFPVTAPSAEPPQPAPVLEYKMYLFEGGAFNVETILAPTLNFVPGRGLRFAISFDDQQPQMVDALKDNSEKAWEQAVSDGVRKITSTLNVDGPGYHTLKFRMVDPGVVLEKLVVSQGRLPESYLGPPESYRSPAPAGK
jgi:hypothetical protein